jgi:hypothetical protein
VPAKEEEAKALREVLSSGAWHRHHGGAMAMIAIDWHSRVTRRLGGNVACQWPASTAAGEGMRGVAHRELDGAPWCGSWPEFHRRAAQRGAKEGDRIGMITGTVSG